MFGTRRSKSFIQRGDDDDTNTVNSSSSFQPKKSAASFHATTSSSTNRNFKAEDDNDDDKSCRSRLSQAANSSAETMEHFTTLQKAHDTLYKEHVHLQEQMDDAVELLKYLKEEKGNYEDKILQLTSQMGKMEESAQESVVSMTIVNLTKDKMELKHSLGDAQLKRDEAIKKIATLDCENSELTVKIDSLKKVKEAYDLQTRQQLDGRAKLGNLEKERGELLDRVRTLERVAMEHEGAVQERDQFQRERDEYEVRLDKMTKQRDGDRTIIRQLQQDREHKSNQEEALKEQLEGLQTDMDLQYQTQKSEIDSLNVKLSNSLSHVAQLQRDKSERQSTQSNSLMEMNAKFVQLEGVNNELLQEKNDMQLYVSKMEETLLQKDELLESLESQAGAGRGELEMEKKMMAQQLKSMRDELEGEFSEQKGALEQQLSELQNELFEKEEMERQLQSLQDELYEKENLEQRLQQRLSEGESILQTARQQSSDQNNELMCENESLQYQLHELQEQLEVQSSASVQKAEIHAQLEKEMQERLAKRIAVQLHEQKIAMEAQIRIELEAEYQGKKLEASAGSKELEAQLRHQLMQVQDERGRWKEDQDEIQAKLLDSQVQFEKVRDGFKKKVEKEKARAKDLEKANEDQQIVIEKLSDEYQGVMGKYRDLQEQAQSDQLTSSHQWEANEARLREEHQVQLEEHTTREEEYATRIHELQNEINELLNEQTTHEDKYNQWEDEKDSLVKKYEEKKEELRRAMDDLEQLNVENGEYIKRVESAEEKANLLREEAEENEDSRVKFSVLQIEQRELKQEWENQKEQNEGLIKQMEQLNSENGEFQQQIQTLEGNVGDLSTNQNSTQEERDKLKESLEETSELCLEMETKLSSYKREKEQMVEEYESKIQDLEEMLTETEAAREGLAVTEKEKSKSEMAGMETKHQEVVAGLQSHISDSTSQISKLIDQLTTASSEKAALATKLEAVTSDISATKDEAVFLRSKVAQLESSVESLNAERDASNARITEISSGNDSVEHMLSSLQSERNELAAKADENKKTIVQLEAEREETVAKTSCLEDTVNELQDVAQGLANALESSRSKVDELKTQLEAANHRQTDAESTLGSANSISEDYEAKIQALQSEMAELKETSAQLMIENASFQVQNDTEPQSNGASVDELMKDLVEVNNNFQRVKQDHQEELQKLKLKMRDTQDNNVLLEEAVQDIQVEKEDLELENEELASKLTDLTLQAKKMLLNNESLEEVIQDQQVEYEDRIAELESQLEEKHEDDDSSLLQRKHKAALETIVKLKKEIDMTGKEKNVIHNEDMHDMVGQLKRVEEENVELREVISHLASENAAAKELKFFVLELRAKNMEMSESLRLAQEQNTAAAEILENLTAENEQLRNDVMAMQNGKVVSKMLMAEAHENRLVPFEQEVHGSAKMSGMEAELRRYKSIVSQMEVDRNTFKQQPSELMGTALPSALTNTPQAAERALIPLESHNMQYRLNDSDPNQGAIVPRTDDAEASAYVPASNIQPYHPTDDVGEQIRNLTIENGQLAQRLGGAVAEKEFAHDTLSKLGAKMEELIERNKVLSELAELKGQRASRGASYYPGGESLNNNHKFKLEQVERGRDPDAGGQAENNSAYSYESDNRETSDFPTASQHDDHSAYSDMDSTMGSTILSFEPPKKLEPESASCLGAIEEDNGPDSRNSGVRERFDRLNEPDEASAEEVSSASSSEPRLVKVPGGEYYGQVNQRGHKHGKGKMKYDNGNEYEGQWRDNKRDGKGITKYASGNVYTGTWKTGKRHGFGVFHIKKTGDIYRGNWVQGLKSGSGVYEYADGELDVSYYQEDVRVGEGVRWSASRHQASRLVDGQLVGEEGDMPVEDALQRTKQLGFVV